MTRGRGGSGAEVSEFLTTLPGVIRVTLMRNSSSPNDSQNPPIAVVHNPFCSI